MNSWNEPCPKVESALIPCNLSCESDSTLRVRCPFVITERRISPVTAGSEAPFVEVVGNEALRRTGAGRAEKGTWE